MIKLEGRCDDDMQQQEEKGEEKIDESEIMKKKEKMYDPQIDNNNNNNIEVDEPRPQQEENDTQQQQQQQEQQEQQEENGSQPNIWQEVVNDFQPSKGGDHKILRAIGRTALVNAAVTASSLTGGAAGFVGSITGGAITFKRINDGIDNDDHKEVAKSFAVYGSATSASMAGQAVTGALLLGVAGTSLPVAGAVAFGVGCASGITAGALSEWGVDTAWKKDEDDDDSDSSSSSKTKSSHQVLVVDDQNEEGEGDAAATVHKSTEGDKKVVEGRTRTMSCNEFETEQSKQEIDTKSNNWGIGNLWPVSTSSPTSRPTSSSSQETKIELHQQQQNNGEQDDVVDNNHVCKDRQVVVTAEAATVKTTKTESRSYQWDFLEQTMEKPNKKRNDNIFSTILDYSMNMNKNIICDHKDETENEDFRKFMMSKKKCVSSSSREKKKANLFFV